MAFKDRFSTRSLLPKIDWSTETIVLIGQGKLSRHLEFYFSKFLGLQVLSLSWRECLSDSVPFPQTPIKLCFLLGRDAQLQSQAQWARRQQQDLPLVHCSGRCSLDGVSSWHPLGSFSEKLFPLEMYQQFPFVGDEFSQSLKEFIPELPNPVVVVPRASRDLYHALCVFSANLSSILWGHTQNRAQNDLGLAPSHLEFLMNSSLLNVQRAGLEGVTGPIVRGDRETIAQNLNALEPNHERDIYRGIVKLYNENVKNTKELANVDQ